MRYGRELVSRGRNKKKDVSRYITVATKISCKLPKTNYFLKRNVYFCPVSRRGRQTDCVIIFFLKKVLFVIVFKWYLPPYAITRNTNTLARKLCLFPSLVALSEFISRKAEQRPTDMLTKHNSPVYPSEYRCPIRLTD